MTFHSPLVSEVLNGVKRLQQRPQDHRLPIELPTLNRLLNAIPPRDTDSLTIRVGLMIGYYGMLRPSEWASNRCVNPDRERLLTLQSLSFHPDTLQPIAMSINLRIAKNDPFATGRLIHIPRNPNTNHPCPVRETLQMLVARFGSLTALTPLIGRSDQPLLLLSRQRTLSTAVARRRLREACREIGIDDMRHTLHSLRIGAATYLARQGVPVDDIRRLGGWRSTAVQGYIRLDREWALTTALFLCKPNPSP